MNKFKKFDWELLQKEYDKGITQEELSYKFNISKSEIYWGVKNGLFKSRTPSESLKISFDNGKLTKVDSKAYYNYRQLCKFKFNVFDYTDIFDLDLIKEFGFYKAKNRGDNKNGVSRDHIYSVKEGFINNIHPYIISHPMNCKLMRHQENNKKKTKCNITLSELKKKINEFDGVINNLEIFDDSVLYKKIVKKDKYKNCKCGSKILSISNFCLECYSKNNRKVDRPSKEKLLNDLQNNSFIKVGKLYGVSDNAIRKWCIQYNMSTKSSDYK